MADHVAALKASELPFRAHGVVTGSRAPEHALNVGTRLLNPIVNLGELDQDVEPGQRVIASQSSYKVGYCEVYCVGAVALIFRMLHVSLLVEIVIRDWE